MGKVVLSNGVEIPDLCLGTGIVYGYEDGRHDPYHVAGYWVKSMLKDRKRLRSDYALPGVIDIAMNGGCRAFDTSRAYGGAERVLGKTLKKYDRHEYFIVTKMCNADQFAGDARAALEKSLGELGMEYVDLYLLHWPVKDTYIETWRKVERLHEEGLCKSIGVCNCNIHHLEKMKESVNIMPMVNQFECHPLFTQDGLREYCQQNGIQIMAYTSTARMDERLYKTCLVPIAEKYHKSVAQIILRWHQQIGNIPIVNSYNKNHFRENTDIYDFKLTEEETAAILKININSRLRYDPDNCDFRQL